MIKIGDKLVKLLLSDIALPLCDSAGVQNYNTIIIFKKACKLLHSEQRCRIYQHRDAQQKQQLIKF